MNTTFDPPQDTATVGERWTKWVRRFENLLISLREFDPAVRRGLLLTYVGESPHIETRIWRLVVRALVHSP